MGEVGRKEEMGEKKKWKEEEEIRKKSSVLGCRIVLWFFFFPLYLNYQLVIGGQKTLPLRTDQKGSYSPLIYFVLPEALTFAFVG
jgi:hypothetical protein